MGKLVGKVAVVTGAAQGIGAEYARALSKEGAQIVIADVINSDSIVAELVSNGHRAIGVECDVASYQSCEALMNTAIASFGRIDILVNNAARFASIQRKPFFELEGDEWDGVMAVNVRGPFNCVKAAFPHMKRQECGKIVNISSATVFSGTPGMLHYVTSKGAVVAFTRALARELGAFGIVVNGLAPGLTMSDGLLAQKDALKVYSEIALASRALKREQLPCDLNGALLYLVSDDSNFMTGQTIVVDGGYVMR